MVGAVGWEVVQSLQLGLWGGGREVTDGRKDELSLHMSQMDGGSIYGRRCLAQERGWRGNVDDWGALKHQIGQVIGMNRSSLVNVNLQGQLLISGKSPCFLFSVFTGKHQLKLIST